jgi:hypothetical protein
MQVIIMSDGFPGEIVVQQGLPPLIPILPNPIDPKRLLTAIEDVLSNPHEERTVARFAEHLPSNTPPVAMAQDSGA